MNRDWKSLQRISKGHLSGTNKLKGDYGENFICYELIKRNYQCYKNMIADNVDLVVKGIGGTIKTIQVKTASLNNKSYCFSIGNLKYREGIDYFAFVFLDKDNILSCSSYCLVPAKFFQNYKSNSVFIRLESKKYLKFMNKVILEKQ